MRSRVFHFFPAFLLLLWSSGTAMGQFVNIRLELPAGVQFDSQIVKTHLKSHGEEIIWMKMVANENLTFILSRSHTGSVKTDNVPIYYLDDGSDNFLLAKRYIGSSHSVLHLHPSGLLIRDLKPQVWKLNAWIGLPNAENIIYSIEYL